MDRVLFSTLSRVTLYRRHARHISSTTRRYYFYDVIVSGGGMVGAAMTSALANCPQLADKKILMLEGGPEKTLADLPEKFSSRTVALSPNTVDLLEGIGAWEHIEGMRCQAVKRMQVWDSSSKSLIGFNHPGLMDALAYIVENDVVQEGIRRSLLAAGDGVEVRYETRVKGYTMPTCDMERPGAGAGAQVHLEDGETLSTRLLIGADGFQSLVRKTAGITTLQWDYDQVAVVATVKLSEPTENNVAWQRFLTTGPVALLPLSSQNSCLIWSTTPDKAKNLLRLDHDSFVDAVNNAFWSDVDRDQAAEYANNVLDQVLDTVCLDHRPLQQFPTTIVGVDDGSRASFPLGFMHSNHYVKPSVALIGDAAHRCHPMAGQGVNLGFGDVACLRDKLIAAATKGSDLGSIQHLLSYETVRQRHVVPTIVGVDALYRLYRTSWSPVVLARSLGLQMTNSLEILKSMLMNHAMR